MIKTVHQLEPVFLKEHVILLDPRHSYPGYHGGLINNVLEGAYETFIEETDNQISAMVVRCMGYDVVPNEEVFGYCTNDIGLYGIFNSDLIANSQPDSLCEDLRKSLGDSLWTVYGKAGLVVSKVKCLGEFKCIRAVVHGKTVCLAVIFEDDDHFFE